MLEINMSLANAELYQGLQIEEVGGRSNLKIEDAATAANIVGRNAQKMVDAHFNEGGSSDTVILSGPMAMWSYLLVFHSVVHRFKEIRYHDGKLTWIVARHG
jgi:hypothetical protein